MISRECLFCGNRFETTGTKIRHGLGKYCSHRCYGLAKRHKERLICEYCGIGFDVPPSQAEKRRYCSDACFRGARRDGSFLKKSDADIEEEAIDIFEAILNGTRKHFPHGFWSDEHKSRRATAITKHLFEVVLKVPIDDIPKRASKSLFNEFKLGGMRVKVYGGSYYDAVMDAYPARFSMRDFSPVTNNYWTGLEGRKRAIDETRLLFEQVLKLDKEQVREYVRSELSHRTFKEHDLQTMLNTAFRGSPVEAILTSYPELDLNEWDFKEVPQGFLNSPDLREKAKKEIRDGINVPIETLPSMVSKEFFRRLGLNKAVRCFNDSPIEATLYSFPELANREIWEFRNVPNSFWQGELGIRNARDATRWLFENLEISIDDRPIQISTRDFKDNYLGGMLNTVYGYVVKAVIDAFPEQNLSELDFLRVPRGYWQGEEGKRNAKAAIKELIDNRLKIPHEKLPDKVSIRTFNDHRLRSALHVFGESPAEAIIQTFPEEGFKREQFRCFHELARIGKCFEFVLCDIWAALNQKVDLDFVYNRHHTESGYIPDFQLTSQFFFELFGVSNTNITLWADAKVSPAAFFESATLKYLEHADHLVIITLWNDEPAFDDDNERLFSLPEYSGEDFREYIKEGRLSFFSVKRLRPCLDELKEYKILDALEELSAWKIPERYTKEEPLFKLDE